MDASARLRPLHEPTNSCLDVSGGDATIEACSASSTQTFSGLGGWGVRE